MRDDQAVRRHMEDNNSEKFVRTQVYNVANRSVATMAAIRLLLRDKKLLIRVATNTKIAETLMFAKFTRKPVLITILILRVQPHVVAKCQ
jgi:hypothetical protein